MLLAPSVGHFSFVSMAGLPHEFALCRLQVIGRLHVLADLAARTLTPIARPMWWLDPRDEATFTIHDQFALGDDFIVAPVVERGATTRNIYLTQGVWRDPFAEVGHHALGQAYSLGNGAGQRKAPYLLHEMRKKPAKRICCSGTCHELSESPMLTGRTCGALPA